MRWLLTVILSALPSLATAQDRAAGDFDYYVLSLSWSPNWCALEGDARNSPQCDPARDHGWILHGLWPQYTRGYPSNCPTTARAPSRAQTAAMADIMGTSGLAWYQWNKHGRCTGLDATAYFDLSRRAYLSVTRPPVFRRLDRAVALPAHVVEEAFLEANPGWQADMLTVTCKQGRIQEARLCLTKSLGPRICEPDVRRDCTLDDALLDPIR